jgi:3-hydroxyisobutyrate dehydrogenase-like beta-hydroxyacid dehydrogenase
MNRIGLIGLGLVGNAIAQRLLAAGWEAVGFDVAADRNAALQSLGGRSVDSAAELCAACERIVLSLPTSGIVRQVLEPLLSALAGKTIIDTTTGDPDEMAAIGRELLEHGAAYLVATIAGSSLQVSRSEGMVMIGGAEDVAARCEELLSTFSRQRFYVGSWLAAARMKLVVNLVLGLNRAVLAEGLSFAKACGIDPRRALEVLQASPAYSHVMETKGEKMISQDFTPQARLAQHAKDVGLILELGKNVQAPLPLSTLHEQLLQTLIEQGYGEHDNSAIIRAFDEGSR